METATLRGVHTTATVQGDTLGDGLNRCCLPQGRVRAQREAGFPEALLFSLFPGMGAWRSRSAGRLRGGQRHDPERPPHHRTAAPQPGRDAVVDDASRHRPCSRSCAASTRTCGGAGRTARPASGCARRSPSRWSRPWICGPETALTLTTRDLVPDGTASRAHRARPAVQEGAVEVRSSASARTTPVELGSGNTVSTASAAPASRPGRAL